MDWLAQLIDRYGPWRIFWGALVGLATIGGVISLVDDIGGWALLVGITLISGAILVTVLHTGLGRERQRNDMLGGALRNLRRYVSSLDRVHQFTELWKEEITVNKGGNTRWHSTLTTRVEADSPSPLHFIDWEQGGEELSRRERRRLEISVRAVPGGGRIPVEEVEWKGGTTVSLMTHLLEPVPPGNAVTVEVDFAWPHTLPGLWRGGVERLEWTPNKRTERFEFLVMLDASYPGKRPLGINTSAGLPAPSQRRVGDQWHIEGGARNLAKDQTLWMELDPRKEP